MTTRPINMPEKTVSIMRKRAAKIRTVDITWFDAMTWADRNGIVLGERSEEEDLDAANELRAKFGLPQFNIVVQRDKLSRLPLPTHGDPPASQSKAA